MNIQNKSANMVRLSSEYAIGQEYSQQYVNTPPLSVVIPVLLYSISIVKITIHPVVQQAPELFMRLLIMAKEAFQRKIPHVNVETLGLKCRGKSTLTAMITKVISDVYTMICFLKILLLCFSKTSDPRINIADG
jgi:hypothetical protein